MNHRKPMPAETASVEMSSSVPRNKKMSTSSSSKPLPVRMRFIWNGASSSTNAIHVRMSA